MFPPEPALECSCLTPRERWQCRKALTERAKPFTFHFSLFTFSFRRLAPAGLLFYKKKQKSRAGARACRGDLIQFVHPCRANAACNLSGITRLLLRQTRHALRAPGEPFGYRPLPCAGAHFGYFHCTCIGANLPLPLGEVAARSADGEGKSFFCFT